MNHRLISRTPHVDDPDLVDRLRELEGDHHCRGGEPTDANSGRPVREAYARWKAKWDAEEDREWAEEKLAPTASTMIVINGHGGRTRYFVRGDGSISFSAGHALASEVDRARAAGFRIE